MRHLYSKRRNVFLFIIIGVFSGVLLCAPYVFANSEKSSWYDSLDLTWGGHLTARGSVSWPDDDSYHALVGLDPRYDGSGEVRLKTTLYVADWGTFDLHYETIFQKGDTLQARHELERIAPRLSQFAGQEVNDDRRLFDLTATLDEGDDSLWYHRLDRLAFTLSRDWGTVRIGRQAITWGNGLLFNTMDLFNPFAPTDIEREYKTGDDMIVSQMYMQGKDVQVLYVPRRNPATEDVEWEQSSLAGKIHLRRGRYEFDLLLAGHYDDLVVGGGCVGFLGRAIWRVDGTLTFLRQEQDAADDMAVALTANMDYSWTWQQKNWYGLIEFYYNSLPEGEYADALTQALLKRLERGELFTLGNAYLGGQLHVEPHPLFNTYLTLITNLSDPSGVIQPRAVWNVKQNFELTAGGSLYFGAEGTEYGGFELPGTGYLNTPSPTAFLWFTYYF